MKKLNSVKKLNKVVDLLFRDAIEKAEEDLNVKKMMKEGYFLCSVFTSVQNSIDGWILHFYSSNTKKMIDCTVSEEVTVGEETEPMDASNISRLVPDGVKITGQEALEAARARFKGSTINILLTLHDKGGRIVWTVNMISPGMTATSYDIDAASGEVINEKVTSLVTRYSRGG